MKLWILIISVATASTMSGDANAAQYVFAMSGKVRSVEVSQQTSSGVIYRADIPSNVLVGDNFRLSGVLTASDFNAGPLNTPSTQIHYGKLGNLAVEAGTFKYSSDNAPLNFTTLELSDNQTPFWGARQALSGILDPANSFLPVQLGDSQTNLFYTFNAMGGLAGFSYQPDINSLYSLDQYASLGGAFGFYNSGSQLQALYTLTDFKASLSAVTAAVPEPATWAMMLVGFGAIGFGMRRRKSKVSTTVAYA